MRSRGEEWRCQCTAGTRAIMTVATSAVTIARLRQEGFRGIPAGSVIHDHDLALAG